MTYPEIWHSLTSIYQPREAQAVARLLIETLYGGGLTETLVFDSGHLNPNEQEKLLDMVNRLRGGEPVQYVLGKADFAGRQFTVGPGVLIPRPETAVLTQLAHPKGKGNRLLDIGTGSGCIAITLKLDHPETVVEAWDVSPTALDRAKLNAEVMGADVSFRQVDMLHAPKDQSRWDVIVSNPPYVCEHEKEQMSINVLYYEPSQALFVPDDDPQLFYRAIGRYSIKALNSGGQLFLECNPEHIDETANMLAEMGLEKVEIVNDQFDKRRFITAQRP